VIDFGNVRFVHPSGLAFAFGLAFTLVRSGYGVSLREPEAPDARDYLRRSDFWGVLKAQGFDVAPELLGFNLGRAPGLIEPSVVTTTGTIRDNVTSSTLLFDRLQRALERAGLPGRGCARRNPCRGDRVYADVERDANP